MPRKAKERTCPHDVKNPYYCPQCPGKGVCADPSHGNKGFPHKSDCAKCYTPGTKGSTLCAAHLQRRSKCYKCRDKTTEGAPVPGAFCEHKVDRSKCRVCSIMTYVSTDIKTTMQRAFLKRNTPFTNSVWHYLGCDSPKLKEYLEEVRENWMTWENYNTGKNKWFISFADPIEGVEIDEKEFYNRLWYRNLKTVEAAGKPRREPRPAPPPSPPPTSSSIEISLAPPQEAAEPRPPAAPLPPMQPPPMPGVVVPVPLSTAFSGFAQKCEHGKQPRHCRYCDILRFIQGNMETRIREAFTERGMERLLPAWDYMKCDHPATFKQHIEDLWEPWMNWDNYGKNGTGPRCKWQFDHIKPLGSKTRWKQDPIDDDEFIARLQYTNIRPIDEKQNVAKATNSDEHKSEKMYKTGGNVVCKKHSTKDNKVMRSWCQICSFQNWFIRPYRSYITTTAARLGFKVPSPKEAVGGDAAQVRAFIESKLEPGMTFDNYGKFWVRTANPDFRPQDATDLEDFIKRVHYTNLIPVRNGTQPGCFRKGEPVPLGARAKRGRADNNTEESSPKRRRESDDEDGDNTDESDSGKI